MSSTCKPSKSDIKYSMLNSQMISLGKVIMENR